MSLLEMIKTAWQKASGTAPAPPVGNAETHGPAEDEHPPVSMRQVLNANTGNAQSPEVWAPHPAWNMGLWARAVFKAAHRARIGANIVPLAVVVHTTDMHPDSHDALVKSWTEQPGAYNAAHFLIGRTATQGTLQFCPITRNSNHAGGPGNSHGWWRTSSGALIHPNTISVGIEIDCAGRLYKDTAGRWRCGEYQGGKLVFSGTPIPLSDVYVDPQGHGWHVLTPYQMETLAALVKDLKACLPEWKDYDLTSNGGYLANGVPWAELKGKQVVGHATLDPNNKTDPGPQVIAWIKENY